MKRRPFDQKELSVATATGFVRAIDRHRRPHIKSYAVDNHDPLKPTDRDDAIYAERTEDGGYLLHVTIADVAAHIPKDSVLDKAAQKRAFTIYRPPARDPMFPFVLSEDRFSLEHEQERLGLTVTIKLDAQFRQQGISFTRTLVEAQCQDYATASERMSQPGDDFALLAQVARGIREHYRPQIRLEEGNDLAFTDKNGLLRQGDPQMLAATKLVQILMIYANNQIADFFDDTGLPFLFRNHDGIRDGSGQMSYAVYEPMDKGHAGLRQSDNLQGAYSHCTSPIRRYADLVNQRFQHYAADVIEGVAEELAGCLPEGDGKRKEDLLPLIWSHGKELMTAVAAVHQARGFNYHIARQKLKECLSGLMQAVNPQASGELYAQADPLAQMEAAALRPAVPYTYDELQKITQTLNKEGAVENEAVREMNRSNLAKWEERVQMDFAAGHFESLSETAFSTLLRRAARTGRMNEDFAREALERIKNGTIDKAADCYSVLVLSKEYQNTYWRALKRAALNAIERDPMVTNNIFDIAMREGEFHPKTHLAEAQLLDASSDRALPLLHDAGIQPHIDAALVITYMPDLGDRMFTAGSYSLGYNKKETARHARFNFIRALTFGELGPFDQTVVPMPLYAELNHGRSRYEVLQEITDSMDMSLQTFGPRQQANGGMGIALKVSGPGLERPIYGFVVAPTAEEAREKAATQVLRSIAFKRAYENQKPMVIDFPSNPIHAVRELAEARGWRLEEPERAGIRQVESNRERTLFGATLRLHIDDNDVIEIYSEGGNKGSTLLRCFEQMRDRLEERGLMPRRPERGQGNWATWAHHVTQPTTRERMERY